MIKSKINAELTKLKSIKTESELYWIFFRLIQITSTGGLLIFLMFSLSLLFRGALDAEMGFFMGPTLIVTPILLGAFQIILAEFALRAVKRNDFWGTVAGLVMSIYLFPSYLLLLGCFGLYSFLNPGFQRQHLMNSPEWFKNLLTNLHLNKMEPIEAVEPVATTE